VFSFVSWGKKKGDQREVSPHGSRAECLIQGNRSKKKKVGKKGKRVFRGKGGSEDGVVKAKPDWVGEGY